MSKTIVGKGPVISLGGLDIRRMGLLLCGEGTQINILAPDLNARHPWVLRMWKWINTFIFAGSATPSRSIMSILPLSSQTKIRPPIVQWIIVSVVKYFSIRQWFTRHVYPSDRSGGVVPVGNIDKQTPIVINNTSDITDRALPNLSSRASSLPTKDASFWVIIKKATQIFLRQNMMLIFLHEKHSTRFQSPRQPFFEGV